MNFQLETFTPTLITNVNPRAEKHGVETVTAIDINFKFDARNDVLNHFHPDLLQSMYRASEGQGQDQDQLDGVEVVSNLPVLKFPSLNPVKWEQRYAGYLLEIDYGLGGSRALKLEGCDVGKFAFDMKEGGTVEVKFQIQCNTGLTERELGKLSLMIGQEVKIRVTAPKVQMETAPQESPLPFNGASEAPTNPFTPEQALIESQPA